MLFSNNAEPINMLRVSRVEPFQLPSLLSWLGPVRTEFFLGQLSGYRFMLDFGQYNQLLDPQPYIHGEKISFRPTPNFEFSVSRTTIFAGSNSPFTLGHLLKTLGVSNTSTIGRPRLGVNDPGDRRSSFDFSYRIPGVRKYLLLYADSFTDDEISPLGYPRRAAMNPGIYVAQFPKLPHLDFRAEAAYTPTVFNFPGFFYYNVTYKDGYTNNNQLLGDWVGRQGQALNLWSTYWFSSQTSLQVGYRQMTVDPKFLQGGRLQDFSMRADVRLAADLVLQGGLQYEKWRFPLLASGQQSNVLGTVQFIYRPRWGRR